MKKVLKITGRVLLGFFLTVYVLVALANYSVVQSLLGSWASSYLSNATNSDIRIGSLGINLFHHVRMHDVLVCDPQGDTVLCCKRLTVRFDGFPVGSNGINLRRVSLRDGFYNLVITEDGINLKFLIDFFKSEKKKETKQGGEFVVRVNSVNLRNMRFRMRLKNYQSHYHEHGINPLAMDYSDINLQVRNLRVLNDNITLKMESMSAVEKSGFAMRNFSGYVYVTPNGISVTDMDLETDDTHLMGDVLLKYDGWDDMSDYINNVHMLADFKEGSVGGMKDAAYWAPVLWPMEEQVQLSGLFYGPVSDLHAENVSLAFGNDTRLTLNGYITGLVDMKNTIINGQITNMTTSVDDWHQILYPERMGPLKLPKQLAALSPLAIDEITFIGTIDEFMATANINTAAGNITADAIMQKDSRTGDYQYIGSLKSDYFALRQLFPNEYVSSLGFDVTLQGASLQFDSLQLSANAIMHNVAMHNQKIDYVEVNAEVNGRAVDADISVQDPLADVTISASLDFGQTNNIYSATANIENFDLARLKLINTEDSTLSLSSQVSVNLEGNKLDELVGSVLLTNTDVQLPDRTIHLDELSLLSRNMDDYKNITLDCDMLHFVTKGYLTYSDLGKVARAICNNYVPVYYNPFYGSTDTSAIKPSTDFSFELHYTDSANVLASIVPGLSLSTGTTITGHYNNVESLRVQARADSLRYGSLIANAITINGSDNGGLFNLSVGVDDLSYGSAAAMKNVNLAVQSRSEETALKLAWDDHRTAPSQGDLNLHLQSTPERNILTVLNSTFAVKGEKWQVADNNTITFGSGLLHVDGLHVRSSQQSLLIDGHVSPDSTDAINVRFDKFDVSIFNILLDDVGLTMAGSLDGNLSVRDFYKTIYYDANMDIEDWQLNDRNMGNAKILSRWDADKRRIAVLLTSVMSDDSVVRYPINMKGFYYPEDGGKLDFDAAFNGFDLKSVAPYLKSFSSQFEGGLHGNFAVNGTVNEPRVSGEAVFEDGLIKVDMFNTVYHFSDTVFFEGNQILLKDFEFSDANKNSAFVNGTVSHDYFKDFAVDLSVESDNIMVMNTTSAISDNFYGTIFANVNGTVKGPVNNISVAANATTNPGSTFAIPLSDQVQISEQNFIRFTPKERGRRTVARQRTQSNSRYKVIVNLTANSNVKLSMPMDFSQLTAMVAATGNGNLQLNIASGSDFSLSGDYIIQSGSFKIDLMDLVSRELTLENGSSLTWTGNPTGANIDIKGVYAQRVSLASLYAGQSSLEQTAKTVNVESIIALSGQLLNPTIKFDFRLPNADQSTEEEVFAIIDRTNEREMINQTVSLLAFNQFYSPSTNAGSFDALSSGIGIAANTVSSVVSSMVEFVDVNINYKSGDELVTNQLDIDISKEWNRFYFETTFGIGGDARTINQLDNGSANTIIGDVLLGYKISPNFHLIAFNRSNANDYTKQDMPYTQGVGVKYSKDFDTWKSLFAPKKKKKVTTTKQKEKKK